MNRVFYITKAAAYMMLFFPGQKVVSKHQNFYSLALNAATKQFPKISKALLTSTSVAQMCSLRLPLTCNILLPN